MSLLTQETNSIIRIPPNELRVSVVNNDIYLGDRMIGKLHNRIYSKILSRGHKMFSMKSVGINAELVEKNYFDSFVCTYMGTRYTTQRNVILMKGTLRNYGPYEPQYFLRFSDMKGETLS